MEYFDFPALPGAELEDGEKHSGEHDTDETHDGNGRDATRDDAANKSKVDLIPDAVEAIKSAHCLLHYPKRSD